MASDLHRLPCDQKPASPDPAPARAVSSSPAVAKCPDTPPRNPEKAPASFLSLPPELHLMISQQLIYPDALSLKHTNRYFYSLVYTGVKLKVEWLVERRQLHLECPNDRRCDLGSDLKFCRGSVRLLMQRRREHIECESRPGLGCLVYSTSTCQHKHLMHRAARRNRFTRWMFTRLTIEARWLMLALIPIIVAWVWMAISLLREGRVSP